MYYRHMQIILWMGITLMGTMTHHAPAQDSTTNSRMPKLFNENGQPHEALKNLLETTGISLNNKPTDEKVQDYIVRRTQTEWLRGANQERWHLDQTISEHHNTILQHLRNLGVTQPVAPEYTKYDVIGVLGASAPRLYERIQHAVSLWNQGVTANRVIIFAGERPRSEEREPRQELEACCSKTKPMRNQEALPETETDIAKFIVSHNDFPETMPNIEVVSAQKHADGSRPTTRDNIEQWHAKDKQQLNRVLFVSNQPFVRYQDTVVRNSLPHHVHIETVGSADAIPNTPTRVLLDNIARWIYAHVTHQ